MAVCVADLGLTQVGGDGAGVGCGILNCDVIPPAALRLGSECVLDWVVLLCGNCLVLEHRKCLTWQNPRYCRLLEPVWFLFKSWLNSLFMFYIYISGFTDIFCQIFCS